jgi:hypothetical protein
MQKTVEAFNYIGVGLLWLTIAALVAWLVWLYAKRNTPWFVLLATFVGWIMPFSVVLLLPLDMTSVRPFGLLVVYQRLFDPM